MWKVKFYYGSTMRVISSGWKPFALDNALKMGDYCAFELVDASDFRVQIFRGLSALSVAGSGRPSSLPGGAKRKLARNDIATHFAKKSKKLPIYTQVRVDDLRQRCLARAAGNARRIELPQKSARDPLESFEDDDDCYVPPNKSTTEKVMGVLLDSCSPQGDDPLVGTFESVDKGGQLVSKDVNVKGEMHSSGTRTNENIENSAVFQDGTLMLPCYSDIYHRILLRYGRLESSQVVKSMNVVLFAALNEILSVAQAMEMVNAGELLLETLEKWDNVVNLGEVLKFNVGWLRESVDQLKTLLLRRSITVESLELKLKNHQEAVDTARERLSKLRENVESAEKELESLVQAKNDGAKALLEARSDLLKQSAIFELKI
ncbi:hypothetical protein IFM89_009562 [Coptis chinensis]|uniref:TF-B3 domain-containing protein n=1 Tax=Coptis chinensis TaxID=261450 RepID=A0A835MDJ7_9MAGN|nr:hypothetical protein IFM89_009562 [Coptis chinensis]